ncbi:MAG: hypothetical protein GX444_15175 [Myxococcales bacterium]|nr:hypothetical protein [Myxococcales bacterium]
MTDSKPHLVSLVPDVLKELLGEAQNALSRTETQIGSFIGHLADKGSITPEEAVRFGASFHERAKKSREDMSRFVDLRFALVTRALQIPTREEVDGLRERIRRLQRRVESLAARLRP